MTLEYVALMAERLSPQDQLSLIERLAARVRQAGGTAAVVPKEPPRAPQDLYGVWREHFPEDPDIDALLHEIRHEWEEEWPEVFKPRTRTLRTLTRCSGT